MSKKLVEILNGESSEITYMDKVSAFAEITLAMNKVDRFNQREELKEARLEKSASASYIIPTALGLGAAGTAAYIGTKDATSRAKLKAARQINNPYHRDLADKEIEGKKWNRAAPVALGAGLGAAYLTGTGAAEKAITEKGSIQKMKWGGGSGKLVQAPGTAFQKGLRRLGATTAQGKGIAGALTLGAGALAGKYMGEKMGDDAVAAAKMSKSAGLFLKPSDLADNHHDLSAALENKLNAVDDGRQFKKQASNSRLTSAAAGAAVGLAYEPLRQTLSKPLPVPKPQKPKGTLDRVRNSLERSRYESDKWRREHPVTATLVSGAIGGGVGAATNFGKGISELVKTKKGKV